MDYEKMYKAVLETATQWIKDGCSDKEKICLESIFPELRESEDERIREGIVKLLTVASEAYLVDSTGIKKESYLAWLEKQKECVADSSKTSANEDESIRKFLVDYFTSYKIGNVATKLNGVRIDYILAYLEKQKKPEDVSASTMIPSCWTEKQKDASKAIEAVEKIDKYINEHLANAHDMKDSNPDKKYYRGWDDALGAMAGILQDVYLEKENKFAPRVLPCSAAWFEDDDEEQKERKPAEWSEEDEEMLNSCISSIEESKENRYAYKETDGDTSYDREIAWLKSLPLNLKKKNEDIAKLCSNEWSDEDEKMLQSIIKDFRAGKVSTIGQEQWLKSLRPSWKPSEEQMKALQRTVNKLANTDTADSVRLSIIYDNLKKLM